jgi:hypothetical protein
MAHHLAELMVSAKNTNNVASRRAIEAEVCGLIAKLWSHRGEFKNHINPFTPLAPVLTVIQTLDADNRSWIPRDLPGEASSLYDVFRRLMIAAILNEAGTSGAEGVAQAKKTAKFQSADEKKIIEGLGIWSEALSPEPKVRVKIVYGDEPAKADEGEKSIDQITKEIIAEARLALDRYEAELARPKPVSARRTQNRVKERKRS